MASHPTTKPMPPVEYPTGDGQPVGETPIHRDNLLGSIEQLRRHFAGDPMVYISGNMFLYYVPGRKRRHVSPDVFVVKGIPDRQRDAYFLWEEGKGPDVVIEFTSATTSEEDLDEKFQLYQDTLQVPEYFLFDPKQEYLVPSMQGYRLVDGRYVAIEPVDGRLPSEVLGLHLQREGVWLRLYDPRTGRLIPTSAEAEAEAEAARARAEAGRREAEAARARAEAARQEAEAARQLAESAAQDALVRSLKAEEDATRERAAREQAEAERDRLLAMLEELKRKAP